MDWTLLLSQNRLGRTTQYKHQPHRPPWQWDIDRITFSSAFRRMQDKTQVFPLSSSDYVRTRLTHSTEVACVGRSLGNLAGFILKDAGHIGEVHPLEIGLLVAAATLGHDIGNPPFGHSGENAIRNWFSRSQTARKIHPHLTDAEAADFAMYEGNAQGFRVLARLQMYVDAGGMQLTASTLGAFTKYPVCSWRGGKDGYSGQSVKKFGYFLADRELFAEVAGMCGLQPRPGHDGAWMRHPLAFLVEAADDICYRIVDLEDAVRQKLISLREAEDLIVPLLGKKELTDRIAKENDEDHRMDVMRSLAISEAIDRVAEAFERNLSAISNGDFDQDLLSATRIFQHFNSIKELQAARVYRDNRVLKVEAAGFRVIGGLLDAFVGASFGAAGDTEIEESLEGKKVLDLIPAQFLGSNRTPVPSVYQRLLKIVDFVCGMTDSFALRLYRELSGIALA